MSTRLKSVSCLRGLQEALVRSANAVNASRSSRPRPEQHLREHLMFFGGGAGGQQFAFEQHPPRVEHHPGTRRARPSHFRQSARQRLQWARVVISSVMQQRFAFALPRCRPPGWCTPPAPAIPGLHAFLSADFCRSLSRSVVLPILVTVREREREAEREHA